MQFVTISPELIVAKDLGNTVSASRAADRRFACDAVEKALETVGQEALKKKASVHLPRIGCGLAGGEWNKIESLIKKRICAKDIAVFVYDLG